MHNTHLHHENELTPIDGYVDQFNGGCVAEQSKFQQLFTNQGNGLDFCGNLGWYVANDIAQRDSD
ncbi:MAG: hypothetical protein GY780_05940 [bacterium]|nr:hypothetical protein [bacterium]